MKYLSEINSFYSWLMFSPVSAQAQAFWHLLMNYSNRCRVEIDGDFYTRAWITVPNSRIKADLDIEHDTQLKRIRDELISAGRILYKKGSVGKAGMYRIVPFDTSIRLISVRDFARDVLGKCDEFVSDLCGKVLTYTETDTETEIEYYYGGGGVLGGGFKPSASKKMDDELDTYFGMTDEIKAEFKDLTEELFRGCFGTSSTPADVVKVFKAVFEVRKTAEGQYPAVNEDKFGVLRYAFEAAALAGKKGWGYIDGILRQLRKRGLTSYEECKRFDVDREYEAENRL